MPSHSQAMRMEPVGDTRDFLAEAERIIAGESLLLPQRQHLLALHSYAASLQEQLAFARATMIEVQRSLVDCGTLLS